MKYLQRLSCALLAVVILSVIFSITANAESSNDYTIKTYSQLITNSSKVMEWTYIHKDTIPEGDTTMPYHTGQAVFNSTSYFYTRLYVVDSAELPIIKKGQNTKIDIRNVYRNFVVSSDNLQAYWQALDKLHLYVYYSDGTVKTITEGIQFTYDSRTHLHNLYYEFTAEKDIRAFEFREWWYPNNRIGYNSSGTVTYKHFAARSQTDMPNIDVSIETEEVGLLKGLANKIGSLFDKIVEFAQSVATGFTNVITKLTEGFKNIVDSLLELPSKLWKLIEDGLKNLFVPDSEFMVNYSNDWDSLLSERFGAIYQVGTIIRDFVNRVQLSDATNTIELPLVSLNKVGIPFEFGGFDVQIVPAGFSKIVEMMKSIVSIVCTFLFINGLRKRYDEVMGVEQ